MIVKIPFLIIALVYLEYTQIVAAGILIRRSISTNISTSSVKPTTTGCVLDNQTYSNKEQVPGVGPCEQCICNISKITCLSVKCKIKVGCKVIQKPNQCCPDYRCDCEFEGQTYNDSAKIDTYNNPCRMCYCKGGDVMCTTVGCYERENCEGKVISGTCCPKYDHCPSSNYTSNVTTSQVSKRDPQSRLLSIEIGEKDVIFSNSTEDPKNSFTTISKVSETEAVTGTLNTIKTITMVLPYRNKNEMISDNLTNSAYNFNYQKENTYQNFNTQEPTTETFFEDDTDLSTTLEDFSTQVSIYNVSNEDKGTTSETQNSVGTYDIVSSTIEIGLDFKTNPTDDDKIEDTNVITTGRANSRRGSENINMRKIQNNLSEVIPATMSGMIKTTLEKRKTTTSTDGSEVQTFGGTTFSFTSLDLLNSSIAILRTDNSSEIDNNLVNSSLLTNQLIEEKINNTNHTSRSISWNEKEVGLLDFTSSTSVDETDQSQFTEWTVSVYESITDTIILNNTFIYEEVQDLNSTDISKDYEDSTSEKFGSTLVFFSDTTTTAEFETINASERNSTWEKTTIINAENFPSTYFTISSDTENISTDRSFLHSSFEDDELSNSSQGDSALMFELKNTSEIYLN